MVSWKQNDLSPDKLQAFLLDKRKSNNTDVKFVIGSGEIQPV